MPKPDSTHSEHVSTALVIQHA